LQVGKGNLENPALQRVICVLETTSAVHEGLSDTLELLVSRLPIHRISLLVQRGFDV
jgi:hypothetical protein